MKTAEKYLEDYRVKKGLLPTAPLLPEEVIEVSESYAKYRENAKAKALLEEAAEKEMPSNEVILQNFKEYDNEHNNHYFDTDDWFNMGFKTAFEGYQDFILSLIPKAPNNVTNGICKNKCENFPECKPCGQMEEQEVNWFKINDKWHNAAIVYDGEEKKLFIDGEHKASFWRKALTEQQVVEEYNKGNSTLNLQP